jgi:prepilin peptidase CpaA
VVGLVSWILVAVLTALLLVAAIGDLRSRTIPNWLTGAVALLATGWWWANGWAIWPDIAIVVGIALLLLLLFGAVFAFGAMGGGDVKLIVALALWLRPALIPEMLMVMALAGGALTILMLAWHRWRKMEGQPEVPYGVAIVAAGCWVVANDVLTILVP